MAAPWGMMAEFETGQQLVQAAAEAREHGFRKMDAYSPGEVEGLADALGLRRSRFPMLVLIAGIVGGAGGYFMQYYAMAVDYRLNVGGRPFNSWPMFVPVTFELTILTAAVAGLIGFMIRNRLPKPYHPVFNAVGFERATTDRFFLCIESEDPLFEIRKTRQFLENLKPIRVQEVEP